ncbi:hypothetical protein [Leuconostoc falkenbergense]|uniref:hypothetical protein n=1 Tax=Leuconostoc falkenbergense TaxID=2766470 RepID=UPI0024A9E2C6|nr:hypothetical protein [Leuconostoc falkenbergense]MDI6553371.1 hypothetical protein [Leuconostoc falkenbergense]
MKWLKRWVVGFMASSIALMCAANVVSANDAAVGTASIRIIPSEAQNEPKFTNQPLVVSHSEQVCSESSLPNTSAFSNWEIALLLLLLLKILIVVILILGRKRLHHVN